MEINQVFASLDELQNYMAEHGLTKCTVVQVEDGFKAFIPEEE